MNWYARMIYPYTKGSNSTGHYDLQLVGTYTFDGITYTNPIFSYGTYQGIGSVKIFNRSLTNYVYAGLLPYKGYHYNDTTSSTTAEYNTFLNLMTSCIDLDSRKKVAIKDSKGNTKGYGYAYEVTTSFRDYDKTCRNCFTALSLWVSALGDNRFKNYAASHPWTDYIAHAMVNNFPQYWDLQGTYGA